MIDTMSNLESVLHHAHGINVIFRQALIRAYQSDEGHLTIPQMLADNPGEVDAALLPDLLALARDENAELGPALRREVAVRTLTIGANPIIVGELLATIAQADAELARRFPCAEQLAAGYTFRPGTVVTFDDRHGEARLVATWAPASVADDGTLGDFFWTDPWGGSFSIEEIAAGNPTILFA